jgi:hypothetical protein
MPRAAVSDTWRLCESWRYHLILAAKPSRQNLGRFITSTALEMIDGLMPLDKGPRGRSTIEQSGGFVG